MKRYLGVLVALHRRLVVARVARRRRPARPQRRRTCWEYVPTSIGGTYTAARRALRRQRHHRRALVHAGHARATRCGCSDRQRDSPGARQRARVDRLAARPDRRQLRRRLARRHPLVHAGRRRRSAVGRERQRQAVRHEPHPARSRARTTPSCCTTGGRSTTHDDIVWYAPVVVERHRLALRRQRQRSRQHRTGRDQPDRPGEARSRSSVTGTSTASTTSCWYGAGTAARRHVDQPHRRQRSPRRRSRSAATYRPVPVWGTGDSRHRALRRLHPVVGRRCCSRLLLGEQRLEPSRRRSGAASTARRHGRARCSPAST